MVLSVHAISNTKHALVKRRRMLWSDKVKLFDAFLWDGTPGSIQLAHGPRDAWSAVARAPVDGHIEVRATGLSD